jgi:hypothetical protein
MELISPAAVKPDRSSLTSFCIFSGFVSKKYVNPESNVAVVSLPTKMNAG